MRYLIVVVLSVAACVGETTPPETTAPNTTSTSAPAGSTTLPAVGTTTATGRTVLVFFGLDSSADCSEVMSYGRVVPADVDPIEAAFRELLEGPTATESDVGATSWFNDATRDMFLSADLEGGRLVVDFANFAALIPNASTSCGSAQLLAELSRTAFQFEEVQRVAFTFEGSCEAFGGFLQSDCIEIDREIAGGVNEYQADPTLVPPEPLPGSDGAAGSGCVPGPGPLPDGVWFGIAVEITPEGIGFDLACFFFGDAANEAAAEDEFEEIPVPNDYYVRNQVDTLRSIPVPAAAVVHTLGTSIDDGFEAVTFAEWAEQPGGFVSCPGESCLVWLYVNGGQVSEIVEQYTP